MHDKVTIDNRFATPWPSFHSLFVATSTRSTTSKLYSPSWRECYRMEGKRRLWSVVGHCATEFLTVLRSIQVPHRTACSFSITREHKYKLYKPQCSSNVRKMFLWNVSLIYETGSIWLPVGHL